jgi:hypothetical protein
MPVMKDSSCKGGGVCSGEGTVYAPVPTFTVVAVLLIPS